MLSAMHLSASPNLPFDFALKAQQKCMRVGGALGKILVMNLCLSRPCRICRSATEPIPSHLTKIKGHFTVSASLHSGMNLGMNLGMNPGTNPEYYRAYR